MASTVAADVETSVAPPTVTTASTAANDRSGRFAVAVGRLLEKADIRINGTRPWDLRLNDSRFYRRVATDGLLGFAESYVDGWWDCNALDQLSDRCHLADLPDLVPVTWQSVVALARNTVFNLQRNSKARGNVEAHYHLGTDLFKAMLDPRMIYTCGYWKGTDSLDTAQEQKLDLVCRKLGLRPGQRVLDIGSGWGGFAKYAAEKYGVSVVGVNVSSEQVQFAAQSCVGLPVEFRLQDYREIREVFDHVVSIGCLEHVGPKNFPAFMKTVHRCLRDDGLCLLHFIAEARSGPRLRESDMLWMNKYIFPGGVIPSVAQLSAAAEGLFLLEDVQNFGSDYDPTLMAWFENFDRNWAQVEKDYSPRFYRMWKFYLLSCAGKFRARKLQLMQLVLSKRGVRGGYVSVR